MRVVAAAVGVIGELDGLLPYAGSLLSDLLRDQRAIVQPLLPVPAPVAPLPVAEMDEALSQGLARLRGLSPVISDFTADVARALEAGWRPRVAAAEEQARQAGELLRQAFIRLADPRLQTLDEALTAAQRGLPARRPELSEPPRVAELDAVRLALASVSAVDTAIGEALTGVDAVLEEQTTQALNLAAVAGARALLNRVAKRRNELGAALRRAQADVRNPDQGQQRPLTMAATAR